MKVEKKKLAFPVAYPLVTFSFLLVSQISEGTILLVVLLVLKCDGLGELG